MTAQLYKRQVFISTIRYVSAPHNTIQTASYCVPFILQMGALADRLVTDSSEKQTFDPVEIKCPA